WHGRRTALPRHQTLRALLDWSYGLLPEAEQLALRRVSVFIGTFTAEAADAAIHCGRRADAGTLNTLDALVSKSLLSTLTGDDGAERFRLLETTRLYGLERLHESGEGEITAPHPGEYFAKVLDVQSDW